MKHLIENWIYSSGSLGWIAMIWQSLLPSGRRSYGNSWDHQGTTLSETTKVLIVQLKKFINFYVSSYQYPRFKKKKKLHSSFSLFFCNEEYPQVLTYVKWYCIRCSPWTVFCLLGTWFMSLTIYWASLIHYKYFLAIDCNKSHWVDNSFSEKNISFLKSGSRLQL